LLFILSLITAPQLAQAGSRENKERTAKTACLSGDTAKGVALLAELYVSTNEAIHLFNQGRCFEQNGRYEEAIVRFREYQRKNADAGREPDAQADEHIADCQALLGRGKAPAVAMPAAASVPAPVPAPPVILQPSPEPPPIAQVAPQLQATAELTQPTPASSRAGMRIAGVATMVVGLAGIATGVLLNIKANGMANDLEASSSSYSRNKESSRASDETFGWVGYGIGAACLASGAVLYYLGRSQGQHTQVALVPAVVPGQVGAVLQGAF
jgi:tetratricopeptide (TPR) repeat protein